jgi:hypothetical protein
MKDKWKGVIYMISNAPRTQIEDLSELGPELDEGQLVTVTGGLPKDGGTDSTGGPCGSCH